METFCHAYAGDIFSHITLEGHIKNNFLTSISKNGRKILADVGNIETFRKEWVFHVDYNDRSSMENLLL